MSNPQSYKRTCQGPCRRRLSLAKFPSDATGIVGYWCADCQSQRESYGAMIQTERDRAAAVNAAVGELLSHEGVPHSAEVVEGLYSAFGGVKGFCDAVMYQYAACKVGSYGRTRILEMIARMTVQNVAAGGAKKPLELWTQQELAEELARLSGGQPLRLVQAPAEQVEPNAQPIAQTA